MKKVDLDLMIKISKMYYEEGLKQDKISSLMGISKAKVSRLISKAKELGYVKTIVIDPYSIDMDKEAMLKEILGLHHVDIVPCSEYESLKKAVAVKASLYLSSIIKPHSIIGVSWGVTMKYMADAIKNIDIDDVTVVQIKGSIPYGDDDDMSYYVARKLGEKINARVRYLNAPVMVKSKEFRDELLKEPSINSVVRLWDDIDICIFSIGSPSKKSTISNCGYITGDKLESMKDMGAAGEICSRFFNIEGRIYDEDLDSKNTSIHLESLRHKRYSIGIASGDECIDSVIGAAAGRYINCLIIDEESADKIIKKMK